MGYHYYNYEAYIETEKAYTLEKIRQALSAFTIAESTDSSLALSFGDWKLWLVLSRAEHVAEEAAEIGEIYKLSILKSCNARLEIYAEDDPDEIHYNDHLYVLETLSELEGIHVFDPALGEFPYEKNETEEDLPDTSFLEYVEGNDTIEHYVGVLNMHPKLDGIWLNIGATYADEGKHELAVRCYETCISLNPDNSMALYNLADHYRFRLKDKEKATEYYLKSMVADPADGDAPTALGRMYAEDERKEEAIEYMLKGYEADPRNDFACMSLGFYLLLYGDPEKALHFAELAIALGEIPISSLNKGHVHLIRAEEKEAVASYAQSLNAFRSEARFWADYDSDYEVMPQYGITLEKYNSLKDKIRTFGLTNNISLN